jgi:hypothetical protein
VLVGIVPADKAFSGFADDIVIIVASALVISAAVARSGIVEAALGRVTGGFEAWARSSSSSSARSPSSPAIVKNIGALAMLMPAAFQMAKRSRTSPSCMLMPMAFGSLLGGLITLVGTSPNIIVSRVREEMTGEPFGMFDYAPVGPRPRARRAHLPALRLQAAADQPPRRADHGRGARHQDYVTEARIPPNSPGRRDHRRRVQALTKARSR